MKIIPYIYIWVWPSSLQSILRVSVLILLFHTVFLNDLGSTTSFSPGPSYPSNPTSPGQPRALPCIWRMYRKQPLDRVYTSHFKWQVPSQFHINAVCFSVIPATVELASGLTFKEPKCLHDKLKNSMPCVDLAMEGQGYVVWEEVECLRGCREKRVQDQRASSLFFLNSSSHPNLLVMSMAAGKHLLSGKGATVLLVPLFGCIPPTAPSLIPFITLKMPLTGQAHLQQVEERLICLCTEAKRARGVRRSSRKGKDRGESRGRLIPRCVCVPKTDTTGQSDEQIDKLTDDVFTLL